MKKMGNHSRIEDETLTEALPGWLAIHPARTGETRSGGRYPTPEEITRHCGHGPFGRKQARLCHFRFFWPGRPCHRGHHAVRFTGTGVCTACWLEEWNDPERAAVRKAENAKRANRYYHRQRVERAMEAIAGDLDLS